MIIFEKNIYKEKKIDFSTLREVSNTQKQHLFIAWITHLSFMKIS